MICVDLKRHFYRDVKFVSSVLTQCWLYKGEPGILWSHGKQGKIDGVYNIASLKLTRSKLVRLAAWSCLLLSRVQQTSLSTATFSVALHCETYSHAGVYLRRLLQTIKFSGPSASLQEYIFIFLVGLTSEASRVINSRRQLFDVPGFWQQFNMSGNGDSLLAFWLESQLILIVCTKTVQLTTFWNQRHTWHYYHKTNK